MRLRNRLVAWFALAGITVSASAWSQPLPPNHPKTDAGIVDAGPLAARDGGGDAGVAGDAGELPGGHPRLERKDPHGGHGHDPGDGDDGANAGIFEPPEDTVEEDLMLPAGTIAVELRDADDRAIPNATLRLGILVNSVAKGDSRSSKDAQTDAQGRATFSGLQIGAGFAYRVTHPVGAATFAASPFNLGQAKGMHVVLHSYPVTNDIKETFVVMNSVIYVELREDRLQVQQQVNIFNLGRSAWIPKDVFIGLPEGFKALAGQEGMTDIGIDVVDGRGARIRGTFGPTGQTTAHSVDFRWQLPWSGEKDIKIDVEVPPNVAVQRIMASASGDIKLVADGFPTAEKTRDNRGAGMLVTEKMLVRGDRPFDHVRFTLSDIPVPGPQRKIVSAIAACAVLLGIGFAISRRGRNSRSGDAKVERQRLLEELEELERAHAAGDIGPKTYERARREIVDALARTLDGDDASAKSRAAATAE